MAAKDEIWRQHWRPAMAWAYMAICLFDFIIAPVGTSVLITFYKSSIPVWKSLTLENGGLIHVAFGAILGVAAWGRTRESVTREEYGRYYQTERETEQVEPIIPKPRRPSQ